jgi:hypothetical protein
MLNIELLISIMSLLRIPFMISAALAMHIAVTSPNPPPEDTEQLKVTWAEHVSAKLSPVVAKVHRDLVSCG